ncbi:poly(A) polymerase [Pasteurellaceae bacterium RH1A]|nr:poly(A) polymerase [Pasteurellaceae bacterium RH1A]
MKSFFSNKKKTKQAEQEVVQKKRPAPPLAEPSPPARKKAKPAAKASKADVSQKQTIKASRFGISNKDFPNNALSIVTKLHRNGYEAYIVGGCVRDLLLGKKPKDFDIATNARPEEIKKVFGRNCRLIGRRFRLAHVVFGREVYEVATFRAGHSKQLGEHISRTSDEGMLLRDNVYGSLQDDAERRDFSVNALYYDTQQGNILDFYQGIEDLKASKLRLIGDPTVRYQEDPVRMLRAIRFMAKLDMFLDKPTEAPIRELAPLLGNIPPARLFDESLKLLQAGQGLKTYQLLREYGLFDQLFPVLSAFFTEKGDSYAERMLDKALSSTDDRIRDNLRVNPAFLFAALLWYPLREKIDELKNEGGLNSYDALMLAANDILAESNRAVALHRRHTAVIRDIWQLQFQMTKRTGKRPLQTLAHVKFRAGFDLLVMRAEIEGGDLVELSAWWHEFQFSNEAQREEMLKNVHNLPNARGEAAKKKKPKRKPYRRKKKVQEEA